MVFVFSGRRLKVVVPYAARQISPPSGDFTYRKVNFTLRSKISPILTSIDGYAATSPRRWLPSLRQTSSATFAYAADAPLLSLCDIFPVSSGKSTPKGKARLFSLYRKISFLKNISKIRCKKNIFQNNLLCYKI